MSADGDTQDNSNKTANTGPKEGDGTGGAEPRTAEPTTGELAGGVLPNKAAEDDPRRWGDQPDSYDHDAWLQEQKPPHWG